MAEFDSVSEAFDNLANANESYTPESLAWKLFNDDELSPMAKDILPVGEEDDDSIKF